jgi:hypothetical protein
MVLTMVCNIQNQWVCVLCPLLGILSKYKTLFRKLNVFFRPVEEKETFNFWGPSELSPSFRPKTETDPVSET